jgi:hypothetical protein
MKKIFLLLPVSIFLLSGTCKKSNDDVPGNNGGGPDVTLPTSGYLLTMGKDSDNHTDTMTFWFSTNGQEMTEYGHQYLRSSDEIAMTSNGNGTMTVKKMVPYVHNNKNYQCFGIVENKNPDFSSFPQNSYLYTMFHETESELTQFIIKRTDGDKKKFTIESKAFPGYYLGCAKWKNATYATTDRLVFTTVAHEFWFVAK